MYRRQKKKLFNRKYGYRLVKLPRNFQTWTFQYYTGIGAVTYKRICTEKIPDGAKYLINTRNVENFNRIMAGKKVRMKRHEKKMDITPELMLSAYNTLIQGCKSQPASEDGTCSSCILYQHCPGASDLLPENWKEIHYPYLEGNTLHYIKAGKVKQIVFARREDAEERLAEMKEGVK